MSETPPPPPGICKALLEMKKLVIFHICALPQLYVKVGPPLEKISGSAPAIDSYIVNIVHNTWHASPRYQSETCQGEAFQGETDLARNALGLSYLAHAQLA